MATISITSKKLQINLSTRERYLLGRPNLALDLVRVDTATLEPNPARPDFGVRTSKRPLFGKAFGEYRYGSRKLLVLGTPRGGGAILENKAVSSNNR
ncbi:MAG: hypothetical protein EBZ61_02515 [Micrococcales bacterium]|nr:hypothetical protein [Micrococcales bacterium]